MTPAQRVALGAPVLDAAAAWADPRYHEWRADGWRVSLIVDAVPGGADAWPCWHATVVYGEVLRGRARTPRATAGAGSIGPALPVVAWSRTLRRAAERLARGALAGVGEPASEAYAGPDAMIAAARARGDAPHGVAGTAARRRLTVAEVQAALASGALPRGTLAAINPTTGAVLAAETE